MGKMMMIMMMMMMQNKTNSKCSGTFSHYCRFFTIFYNRRNFANTIGHRTLPDTSHIQSNFQMNLNCRSWIKSQLCSGIQRGIQAIQ